MMEEAYLNGFDVKVICEMFNVKQHYVYSVLNIKALKVKKKERLLEGSLLS